MQLHDVEPSKCWWYALVSALVCVCRRPLADSLSSECNAWFDKARKPLPRPHRPPEIEHGPSSRVHRSQLHTLKRKRANTEHEGHDSSDLQRARAQRRLFRNVRIHFQELPSTPKVSNVRSRRKRPQGNSSLQVVLTQSLPPVKIPSTPHPTRSSVLVEEEADEGVSAILNAGVDHRRTPRNTPLEDRTVPIAPFANSREVPTGGIPYLKNSIEVVENRRDYLVIDRGVSDQNCSLIRDGYQNKMPPPSLAEPNSDSQPVWLAPSSQTASVSSNSPYINHSALPDPLNATPRYSVFQGSTPVLSLGNQSVSAWSERSTFTDLRGDVSVRSAPSALYGYQIDRGIPSGIPGVLPTHDFPSKDTKNIHYELSRNLHGCVMCGTSQPPLPYEIMPYHLYERHGFIQTWTRTLMWVSVYPANNRSPDKDQDRKCEACNARSPLFQLSRDSKAS